MKTGNDAQVEYLGQTGLLIRVGGRSIIVDPYLSNSVQELDAPDLVRKIPIPYQPEDLTCVDWILLTHDHIDHCDPHTILKLMDSNPMAVVIGPLSVRRRVESWGIAKDRLVKPPILETPLSGGLTVQSVIASHPRVRLDHEGYPEAVGYFFRYNGSNLYLAGDTSVCDELISSLKALPPINIALLPVNEDNYFRRRRGIVGNMSVREAFCLAAEVGIKNLLPVHWDMFEANGACFAEIKAIYSSCKWPFRLLDKSCISL